MAPVFLLGFRVKDVRRTTRGVEHLSPLSGLGKLDHRVAALEAYATLGGWLLQQLAEAGKQILAVVGASGCFWVILHTEGR